MFDFGFWELALIMVVALLVLGPERLPRAARTAGLWVGRARQMLATVKADIDRELRAEELKEMARQHAQIPEIQELGREVNEKISMDTGAAPGAAVPEEPTAPPATEESGAAAVAEKSGTARVAKKSATTRAAKKSSTTRVAKKSGTTRAAKKSGTARAAKKSSTARVAKKSGTARVAKKSTTTRAAKKEPSIAAVAEEPSIAAVAEESSAERPTTSSESTE